MAVISLVRDEQSDVFMCVTPLNKKTEERNKMVEKRGEDQKDRGERRGIGILRNVSHEQKERGTEERNKMVEKRGEEQKDRGERGEEEKRRKGEMA
jgi:hypothetical protein